MGIGSAIMGTEHRMSLRSPPDWLIGGLGGGLTKSGVNVSEDSSLSLTAVWACVNKIANTIALMPLQIYEHNDNSKSRANNHYLYRLVHTAPNDEQTAFEFRQVFVQNMLLWGAGVALIKFDGNGRPIALHNIPTSKVTPKRTATGKLVFEIVDDLGQVKIKQPCELLICRYHPTCDGSWKSPIAVHRETVGSAIAVREFGAKSFGAGINPAGVVSGVAKAINEDAMKTLRQRFSGYEGLGNSHKLMLLEAGEKFERVGMPLEDSQYIESRQFDLAEICRIFDVPPPLIHDLSKSSSWASSVESLKDMFVSMCLTPLVAKMEQEYNRKLISVDSDRYYCEFVTEGLLRGAYKDRMLGHVQAVMNGLLTRNEIRSMENRNPVENGDEIFVPMNLQPLYKAINNIQGE